MRDQIGRKESSLDDAIVAVRDDAPAAGAADAAAERAWERIAPVQRTAASSIEAISGFIRRSTVEKARARSKRERKKSATTWERSFHLRHVVLTSNPTETHRS